tara:strand:+ start:89 stop:217 length:129 start_codon:yes stop_codon:yes gene_type:complete
MNSLIPIINKTIERKMKNVSQSSPKSGHEKEIIVKIIRSDFY